MQALAQRAVEAAVAAGAAYADVRVTYTVTERYSYGYRYQDAFDIGVGWDDPRGNTVSHDQPPEVGHPIVFRTNPRMGGAIAGPTAVLGLGVRAFVHGYWGFASSPYLTAEEAARLGQEAAGQATINAQVGAPRLAELGTIPLVRAGQWVMPGIDPSSRCPWMRSWIGCKGCWRWPRNPVGLSTRRSWAGTSGPRAWRSRVGGSRACLPRVKGRRITKCGIAACRDDERPVNWPHAGGGLRLDARFALGGRMGELPDRHVESESAVCPRVGIVAGSPGGRTHSPSGGARASAASNGRPKPPSKWGAMTWS